MPKSKKPSTTNKAHKQQKSSPPQAKRNLLPNQKEQKPFTIQEANKSPSNNNQGINLLSLIIAIIATIAAVVVVPEVRKVIGLKSESSQQIQIIVPTEGIPQVLVPTPTNGPCVDILDVRFLSTPIFPTGDFPKSEPVTPSGKYIIISTEYKNLQSQPMYLYWNKVFEIAGQHDTSSKDFTYYVPNWSVTWDYAYDNDISENCSENLNPGLWNRCDMVFDIDPSIKNLYLILYNLQTEDGKPFNNACKTSWKIPVNQ